MQIRLEAIEINIDFNVKGTDEIYQNLKTLFSTPVGTVVFDRDLGIDWSILDSPLPQAKAALTIEYIEKVKKYEPRVKVSEVTFVVDGVQGILKPKVVIEYVS
ncbi:MAG: phage baseplate assembly protein W [Clostridium sp.]|jgi:phage baseplate assembly protein W